MSITIPCPGCTRGVVIAADDQRPQVRCPACGFAIDRPSDAITANAPAPSRAIRRRRRDDGDAVVVICAECGEPLRTAADRDEQPTACPVCGNPVPTRTRQVKTRAAPPSQQIKAPGTTLSAPAASPAADDEDAEEYRFATPLQRCPECDRDVEASAVLCLACGFNWATGAKLVREYTPVERRWDGGLALRRRLLLFAACEFVALLSLVGAFLGDFLVVGLVVWLCTTALLAFIFGTFDRIDVWRGRGGRVRVTKQRWLAFVPRRPVRLLLYQYQGVTTGMANDADLWDWVLLIIMTGYAIVPGCIWWYLAFHRDLFYVGLVRDHGSLAVELYRGWNEAVVHDIAKVIRDVGGYP